MMDDERSFYPGDRVMVFDSLLFEDDVSTPLSYTVRPATVVRHYGMRTRYGIYPSCIDVVFDHRRDRVSHGHFTSCVERA